MFVPPRPPYAVRGHGPYVYDADDRRILDLNNNYTSLIHGHARREIVDAATEAIAAGSCFSIPTEFEIALAERLAARMPDAPKWRFANSGSEAVMTAIRLARAATGRDAILRFDGCYHGSYDAVLPPASPGVTAGTAADVVLVPVGDERALLAALDEHGDRLACVVFDAMPNRAGLQPADPEFVALLRRETTARGILLVQDEVITFRIARGGIHSLYAITPDLITLGKVIGGGFPIGAVGGRAELMDLFDPRRSDAVTHPGTFSANPVSLRAGIAALELLTDAEIDRINSLGDRLRRELAAQGWHVTGQGSLCRVHVDDPAVLWWQLYERGLMIAANGLACLSTAIDDDHLPLALEAFGACR